MRYWRIVTLAIVLLWATDATATTYYVDYDQGDDAQAGTSEATAWKHAPGDKNAVGTVQTVTLVPGDTVLLKGGVTYRGSIAIPASGKAGSPVTYKGDGWGLGKAIIDGSAPFGGKWTQCTSADELRGNRNYRSIYHTEAPKGYRFTIGTYENGQFVYPAQEPTPNDPFHFDRTDQLRVIPKDDSTVSQTNSSITDPRHFTSADPSFYDGASVLVWHTPNVTRLYAVTGFDPATHTITHEKVGGGGVYKGRDTYYAIINHPAALSGPGQYWFDEKSGRFYVWPLKGAPANNEYSVVARETGIDAGGKQHVVIEGFIVQKFTFGIRAAGSDVVIRNNEVRNLKSNEKYAIHAGGTNMQVIGNRVTNCQRAVGILAGGKNIIIRDNYVERTSRQGIWLMGVERAEVVGNTVVEANGTHANGISVYLYFKDVLIASNRILKTGSALTFHGTKAKDDSRVSEGLTVYNNLVDGAANCWGGQIANVTIANNTFLRTGNLGTDPYPRVLVNNIIHGGGTGVVRSHNLYTDLAWWQKPGSKNTWSLADGEINWSGKSRDAIFSDPVGGDYHLKAGSPALGVGTDPSEYLPVAVFPDYDFSKDIEGKPHAHDGKWSIGAYGRSRAAEK